MGEQRQSNSKVDKSGWWLHEKNVLLINLVQYKPVLYDFTSPRYSDNSAKNTAWKEIGEHLNTTAARCKARWEQLRSQHRKKIGRIVPSGVKSRKWIYETRMSFLLPFMKERRSQLFYDDTDTPIDVGMPTDQYDYEIKIETMKEEARHKIREIIEDGVHENAEDCAELSARTAEAFREEAGKRFKTHQSSTPTSLLQLLENTPASMKLPLDERDSYGASTRTVEPLCKPLPKRKKKHFPSTSSALPRHLENTSASMKFQLDERDCAAQDTSSSTRTAESFCEQLTKHNTKHFPSTSSALPQFLESTSASSMGLRPDERNDTSYRPVYQAAADPIDQFFSLITTTVKKFNAADQHFLRSKIFNLVSSVEEKYLYQDANPLHIVYSSTSDSPYSGACNPQTSVVPPETIHSSQPLHTSFQEEIQCIQINE